MDTNTASNPAHPDPKQKWANMRRMSYICLVAGVAYPFLSVSFEKEVVLGLAPFFYSFVVLPILAYMGFSSWKTPK